MSDEARDSLPDRESYYQLSDQVVKALENNRQAAYLVYLNLCKRFGAGQGL